MLNSSINAEGKFQAEMLEVAVTAPVPTETHKQTHTDTLSRIIMSFHQATPTLTPCGHYLTLLADVQNAHRHRCTVAFTHAVTQHGCMLQTHIHTHTHSFGPFPLGVFLSLKPTRQIRPVEAFLLFCSLRLMKSSN